HAKDKWTLLPILSPAPDIPRYILGLYDLNVFGRIWNLGGAYVFESGEHFFQLWWQGESVFGLPISFRIVPFRGGSVLSYFPKARADADGTFRQIRWGAYLELGYRLSDWAQATLRYTGVAESVEWVSGDVATADSHVFLSNWEDNPPADRYPVGSLTAGLKV